MRSKPDSNSPSFLQLPGEANNEYRIRIGREHAERASQRQEELAQQSSSLSTPFQRICLWERLHAMPLPRTTDHPLLDVVALQTGLSITQVRDEQTRRHMASAQRA